jgi:hypothetical protein
MMLWLSTRVLAELHSVQSRSDTESRMNSQAFVVSYKLVMSFVLIVKAKPILAYHVFVSSEQPAIINAHQPYLHNTLIKNHEAIY